jgi:hypothetical protein
VAEGEVIEETAPGVEAMMAVAVRGPLADPGRLRKDLPSVRFLHVGDEADRVVVIAADVIELARLRIPDGVLVVAEDGAAGALGP